MRSLILIPALLLAGPALAAGWAVDPTQSTLVIEGQQGANTIRITLPEWTAEIAFDPQDLTKTRIRAEIALGALASQTENASDKAEEERELKGASWFAVAEHPTALFTATGAELFEGGTLRSRGTLTIRGTAVPADLVFTVAITGDTAKAAGQAAVSWTDYGIGWDPAQSGIAPQVTVRFDLTATRMP